MIDLQLVSQQLFTLATETPGSDKHTQAMQHLALFDAVSMHDELVVLQGIVKQLAENDPYLFETGDVDHPQCRFCGRCRCDKEPHTPDFCVWLRAKKVDV